MIGPSYLSVATAIPVTKKQQTATNDRSENRGNPQTPCPDVQPLDSLVPKPTKTPAKAKSYLCNPAVI